MQERKWQMRTVWVASLVLLAAAAPLTVAQEGERPAAPTKRAAEGAAAEIAYVLDLCQFEGLNNVGVRIRDPERPGRK